MLATNSSFPTYWLCYPSQLSLTTPPTKVTLEREKLFISVYITMASRMLWLKLLPKNLPK